MGQVDKWHPAWGLNSRVEIPPNMEILPRLSTKVVREDKMGQNYPESAEVKLENYLKLLRALLKTFGV